MGDFIGVVGDLNMLSTDGETGQLFLRLESQHRLWEHWANQNMFDLSYTFTFTVAKQMRVHILQGAEEHSRESH